MRIHVMSDLHLEFGPFEPPHTEADVVVLAGDVHIGKRGIPWIKQHFKDVPVIYVLGNHEYYRQAVPRLREKLHDEIQGSNIHVLENQQITIDNVLFLGCTLWTDFRLLGDSPAAHYVAGTVMNDYARIRVNPSYRKLRPFDTAKFHTDSMIWLTATLEKVRNSRSVIITHHAPSPISLPSRSTPDPVDAAYASDLNDYVESCGADVWIHGHIHKASQYEIGATRVVCNPRGYIEEPVPGFRPDLVIEL